MSLLLEELLYDSLSDITGNNISDTTGNNISDTTGNNISVTTGSNISVTTERSVTTESILIEISTGNLENFTNFTNFANVSDTVSADIVVATLFKAPLWQTDFVKAVIYCSLTLFIIVVGTLGNIAIIVINVLDNRINNIGRIFIINIAIGDLCVASLAEPICIVGVYYGEAWFDQHWFMCETVAIMCFIACIGSYLSFVLRAINRAMYLCYNVWYYDVYTTERAIMACVVCWIIATIVDSANIAGWGDHNFDQKSHRCVWDRNESFSYLMVIGIVLLLPFPLTIACFVVIFKEIYKRKESVCRFQGDKASRLNRAVLESFRASRNLLIGFITFIVLWAPAGILIMVDFADTVKMEVYLFTVMLAHFHSCADFLINISVDRKFRKSLYNLIFKWKKPNARTSVDNKVLCAIIKHRNLETVSSVSSNNKRKYSLSTTLSE